MENQSNIHFLDNLNVIINFPKDNDQAQIKADSYGRLFTDLGNTYSSDQGTLGNSLNEAILIIDRTAKEVFFEFEAVYQKAKEIDSLENYLKAEELYEKGAALLVSLDRIHTVYQKRDQETEQSGIKELEELAYFLEGRLASIKYDKTLVQQSITEICNRIYNNAYDNSVLELNDLTRSFVDLKEVEPVKAYAGLQTNYKVSNWYSSYGQGPTFLGKLVSGFNTVKELAIGTFNPYTYKASSDPQTLACQKRVANNGRQLGGMDIYNFIEGISKNKPVNAIHSFHLASGSSINGKTFAEIKDIISKQASHFIHGQPTVIPIVFEGAGMWEVNHIAVILIKDSIIEYYDAKGITSENKILADKEHTLRDVLLYCKETFGAETIAENPYPHQFDVHNCGVFVCHHLYDRLVENTPPGTLIVSPPLLSDIESFRQKVIEIAYPVEQKNPGPGPVIETYKSINDSGEDF
jgi:hypothetical protein